MNKKQAGILFRWCLLASAFLLLWGNSMVQAGKLEEFRNGVSVRMSEAVAFKNVKQALQEAKNLPNSYVCWNSEDAADVSNEEKTKRTAVTAYKTSGDMSLVFPAPLISGNYVSQEDGCGCMIDRETAVLIFGSLDVIGLPIRYQDKIYYVRGLFDSGEPVFLYQNGKEDTEFENMELVFPDTENGGMLAEEFLIYCGAGGYELLEGGFYGKICGMIALFPGQLLAAAILVKFAAAVLKKRDKAGQALFSLGLYLILVVLLWRLSGFALYLPERLIPTRWSDLDFWSKQAEAFGLWLKRMERLEPAVPDLLLRRWMAAAALYALPAILASAVVVNPGRKVKAAMRISGIRIWYLSVSFLLPACFCLYFAAKGGGLAGRAGYLMILPIAAVLNDPAWKLNRVVVPGSA